MWDENNVNKGSDNTSECIVCEDGKDFVWMLDMNAHGEMENIKILYSHMAVARKLFGIGHM